jgi:hypothetical protein
VTAPGRRAAAPAGTRGLRAEHVLLLRAATGPPADTRAAWRRWRAAGGTLDALDPGAARLGPRLYGALRRAGVDDPDLPRLKGMWRHAWAANQRTFAGAAGALAALREAGVPALVLKGAALVHLHLDGAGDRQMADVDVLVPPAGRDAALAALHDAGWRFGPRHLGPHLVARHSAPLRRSGAEIDLHWYAQHEPADDRPLWEAAVPVTVHGEPALAPCPADLVLGLCAHAMRWDVTVPVVWAADVAAVVAGGGVDWDRLVARARAAGLTLPAADGLAFVRDELGVAVPGHVVPALRASHVPLRTRLAYRSGLRSWHFTRRLPVLYDHWRRLRALEEPHVAPPPLVDWLAAGFDQPSRGAFARWAAAWPRRAHLPSGRWRSASTSRAWSR